MNFRLEDHSEEVLKAMNGAVLRGLEKCGLVAEGYAKKLVNSPGKRGTGYLRNSITHTVNMEEKAMYIGSPVSLCQLHRSGNRRIWASAYKRILGVCCWWGKT